MLRSLGIVGFLTAVVGMECATVWLLLSRVPSAGADGHTVESIAPADTRDLQAVLQATANQTAETPSLEGVEVDLGEYTITYLQLSTSTTLRIDFHLFGLVASTEVEQFNKVWPASINRFREIVITTVRAAQPADLADPSLALIKRQILEKSNRLFGKPFLRSLFISQFSLVEQ